MKSLSEALREGRVVELPDAGKGQALGCLTRLMEAVPELAGVSGLHEAVLAREKKHNTALGLGVACPHARASGEGKLFCAVGWSPAGIDYGAPDNEKVHLIVMFYIPDSQKNIYIKEVSALAGALQREGGIHDIVTAKDIAAVRQRLLDWVRRPM